MPGDRGVGRLKGHGKGCMGMKNWKTVSIWVIVVLGLAVQPVSAVLVFVQGEDQPIRGYLIREDDREIVIQQVKPDRGTAKRTISRSEIEDMIKTVSEERLEALKPSDPDRYREYAEELAEKKKDPNAHVTSLRLFLIAAHLAPDRLGRSCLLGMVALARTDIERQRFRAMAYLLDPAHDTNVLTMPVQSASARTALDPEQTDSIMKALRLLRQGKRNAAMTLAERYKMKENLKKLTSTIAFSEFEEACAPVCPHCQRGRQICPRCNGQKLIDGSPCPTCDARGYITCRYCGGDYRDNPLSRSLLKRIVRLELERMPSGEANTASSPSTKKARTQWSRSVQQGEFAPLPPLSLETLTEFDPRKNIFRDGKWQSS